MVRPLDDAATHNESVRPLMTYQGSSPPDPRPTDDDEPTSLQQGMLFHALANPGLGVDIEQISFRFRGTLNTPAFEDAWRKVLTRHDILRASFDWTSSDRTHLVIALQATLPLQNLDWRAVAATDIDTRFDAFMRQDRRIDFAMDKPPLMRMALIRAPDSECLGLWTFHHALLDGRSFPMVLEEVLRLYRGDAVEALPVRQSFDQHVRHLQSLDLVAAKRFWEAYLAGVTAPQREATRDDSSFAAIETRIGRATTARLAQFAGAHQVSLNTLLQTAWALLLRERGERDDVVFGVTRACRHASTAGAESMIGLLINTVPLRIAIAAHNTLAELLTQVRHQHRVVRPFENSPLPLIQSWGSQAPGKPLFDSLVVFDDQSLGDRMTALGEVALGWTFSYQGQTNFPLTLVAYGGDDLLLRLEYSTVRLDEESSKALCNALVGLLDTLPDHAATEIAHFCRLDWRDALAPPRTVSADTGAARADADHEAWWVRHLADAEFVDAPYARAVRAAGSSGADESLQLSVPHAFCEAVVSAGYSPAHALTVAFLMFLTRISNRIQYDVGVRMAAPRASAELPLSLRCQGHESFGQFAGLVQAAWSDTEAHANWHAGRTDPASTKHEPPARFTAPIVIDCGERAALTTPDETAPGNPTNLLVRIDGTGTTLTLIAPAGAIARTDLDRLGAQLRTALSGLAADLSHTLATLPILPDTEREWLLYASNSVARPYPVPPTLAHAFAHAAQRFADRIALTYRDQQLSYRELDQRSNQVAHALLAHGAAPDSLVGLAMARSADLLVAMLGILKSGAAFLPLDPAYPPDRIRYMIDDANAPLILTQNHLQQHIPAGPVCLTIEQIIATQPDTGPVPAPATGPEQLAYVMYTSGSTGRPKGVQITHHNVLRLMAATDPWFHFGPDDVWTLFHSYSFDFTTWEIWGALFFGGRLVVPTQEVTRAPDQFLALLRTEQVTILNQTPSAFRQLIAADEATGTPAKLALRFVVFGGEALDLTDLQPWIARHGASTPALINMFGITETTVHVTYRRLTAHDIEQNIGSVIGVPIPDLQLLVLDRWQQQVPVGMPGEIYVGGAGLARGYLNRPDLTAERFVPNPFVSDPGGRQTSAADPTARLYKTGDVARYLPGGDLEYLGRADNQIQLRGFRIELGEIEGVLAAHPGVAKVVVAAKAQALGEQQLVAWYLPHAAPVSAGELRAWAARSLAEYMIPQHFIALDALPLTPSGKLDRKALPAPTRALQHALIAPGSDTEHRIAAIWRDLLSLEEVGTRDTFFDLGGHSLLVMILVNRLTAEFSRPVTVPDLFRHPTIEAQARLLTQPAQGATDSALSSADRAARERRQARARQQQRQAVARRGARP